MSSPHPSAIAAMLTEHRIRDVLIASSPCLGMYSNQRRASYRRERHRSIAIGAKFCAMTTKTYRGSCHCGRVKFEADIDLAAGTGKCNCTSCWKKRWWSVSVKPERFRSISDEQELSRYRPGSAT